MTMYESARKINEDLKQLFSSVSINEFTKAQRERILDIMIRFGAVAKFRCRSNIAYDNFVSSCLAEIADTERVKINLEDEFTVLKTKMR